VRTESTEECYTTLGLEPGAPWTEVRRAYKTLAKTWHPDRFTHSPRLQQQALEKFQTINQAYTKIRRQKRNDPPENTGTTPEAADDTPQTLSPDLPPQSPWLWRIALGITLALWLFLTYVIPVLPVPSAIFGMWGRSTNQLTPDHPTPFPVMPTAPTVSPTAVPLPQSLVATVFTLGSTKGEVLAIQGPPTSSSASVWEYNGSRVYFRDGLVWRWEIWPGSPLKARLYPSTALQQIPEYFTVGSTKDEVLAVQGSPTRFTERVWDYGQARVYFEHGRVSRWEEWRGALLKARHPLPGNE
jgi:hypothetical protein